MKSVQERLESKKETHKRWVNRNREKLRLYYREWYKTNGRSRLIDYAEATHEWKRNHPEATSAIHKVYLAVKSGKLIRPKLCSKCGRNTKLSAHHPDYSKPLEVMWLCSSCHKIVHK